MENKKGKHPVTNIINFIRVIRVTQYQHLDLFLSINPYKRKNSDLMENMQDLFKGNDGFIPFDDSKNSQVNTNSRKRKRAELEVITVLTDEDYPWMSNNHDISQFDHATEL